MNRNVWISGTERKVADDCIGSKSNNYKDVDMSVSRTRDLDSSEIPVTGEIETVRLDRNENESGNGLKRTRDAYSGKNISSKKLLSACNKDAIDNNTASSDQNTSDKTRQRHYNSLSDKEREKALKNAPRFASRSEKVAAARERYLSRMKLLL